MFRGQPRPPVAVKPVSQSAAVCVLIVLLDRWAELQSALGHTPDNIIAETRDTRTQSDTSTHHYQLSHPVMQN